MVEQLEELLDGLDEAARVGLILRLDLVVGKLRRLGEHLEDVVQLVVAGYPRLADVVVVALLKGALDGIQLVVVVLLYLWLLHLLLGRMYVE